MKLISLSLVALASLALVWQSASERPAAYRIPRKWQELIVDKNVAGRHRARALVLQQRTETINGLLAIVRTHVKAGEEFYNSTTPRNIAIYLLGELRATEAISELIQWLEPHQGLSLIHI